MAIGKSRTFILTGCIFVLFVVMTYNSFQGIDDVFEYLNKETVSVIVNSPTCELHEEPNSITWVNGSLLPYSEPIKVCARPTKRLLLVAHYRGGSTYLGDIFARNPNVFFWYEPLLVYFQRIIDEYVTNGMSVISDHYYVSKENTLRRLPNEMTWYRTTELNRTLWCRVCMEGYDLHVQTNIRDRGVREWQFKSECRIGKQPYPEHCMAVFYQACILSSMVVVKTIRYPLYLVHNLLRKDQDLKVVFTIRDPRGIIYSRRQITETYTPMEEWINLGISYCNKFKLDMIYLKAIHVSFPGQIIFMRYEDLVGAPLHSVRLLYDFVGHNLPTVVERWVIEHTEMTGEQEVKATEDRYGTGRNSKKTMNMWKTELPQDIIDGITTGCGDSLQELGYD